MIGVESVAHTERVGQSAGADTESGLAIDAVVVADGGEEQTETAMCRKAMKPNMAPSRCHSARVS